MRKGAMKSWLGWVIAAIIVIILLAVYITGTHEIFVKKILDTIDVVIKIREVGP
jgi:hypothetical protein